MKKSKQIAFCGMLAALSLSLMFLGSVIWAFTYIAPLMSSIIILIISSAVDKKSAALTYAAVSILSTVFLPDKECALTYVFFFGYYAIIRDSLEKIKPKLLSYFVKILIYNAGIISSQLILVYVIGIPFEGFWGAWGIIVLIALANLVFIVYEFMLSKLILLYELKYKTKIKRILK